MRPVRKSAQADSQACSDRYMYGLLGRERSLNGVKWGEYMNFSPLPPESPLEKCSSRGEAPMFQKMQRDGQVETQSKEHINVRVTEGGPNCKMKVRLRGKGDPRAVSGWPFAHVTALTQSGSWGTWGGTHPLPRRHRAQPQPDERVETGNRRGRRAEAAQQLRAA